MGKTLILMGICLIIMGLLWQFGSKLGLFHLPGDIHFKKDGFSFHFPLMSSILLSLILSAIFWLIQYFRK